MFQHVHADLTDTTVRRDATAKDRRPLTATQTPALALVLRDSGDWSVRTVSVFGRVKVLLYR